MTSHWMGIKSTHYHNLSCTLDGEELRKRLVASGVRLDAELLKPDPEWKGGGEMREEGIF